jgi:hypothetical protein
MKFINLVTGEIANENVLRLKFKSYIDKILLVRQLEDLYLIPFSATIAAGQTLDTTITIPNSDHFQCDHITGSFTTIQGGVDDGICRLSMQITDRSQDRKLSNALIPLNLLLSPGRRLSTGVAGDPSQQLFYAREYDHLFPANGGISLNISNSASSSNTVELLFIGRNLRNV